MILVGLTIVPNPLGDGNVATMHFDHFIMHREAESGNIVTIPVESRNWVNHPQIFNDDQYEEAYKEFLKL